MLCVQSPPIRAAMPGRGSIKRLIGKAKLNSAIFACLARAGRIGRIPSDGISSRRKASGAGFGSYAARPTLGALANLPAILIEIDADRKASRSSSCRPSIIIGSRSICQTTTN